MHISPHGFFHGQLTSHVVWRRIRHGAHVVVAAQARY